MVECKWGDAEVDRGLRYLKARFPKAEAWQISATGTGLPDARRHPGRARARAPALAGVTPPPGFG